MLGTLWTTLLLGCTSPDPDVLWPGDEDPDFDGTAPAPTRAYTGGTCPDPVAAADAFPTGDDTRRYVLHLPDEPEGAGVLFLFHGNEDDAWAFSERARAVGIANRHGLVVVAPDAGAGGLGLAWGVPPVDPVRDVTFFDDVLACLSEALAVDTSRVYVAGFSAGGLWAAWLAMRRSSQLAAALVLSGGTDGEVFFASGLVNPYRTPVGRIPVLLAHGDPDRALLDFTAMSRSMADALRDDGHVAIRCPHDRGHDLPDGLTTWGWPFLVRHRLDGSPSFFEDGDRTGTLPASCTW